MGEEGRALHTAVLLSRRMQDGRDEQMAAVRHKREVEEADAMREHGSFQQQMVVVKVPVACRAHGARSRY